jgi:hypothetical protein
MPFEPSPKEYQWEQLNLKSKRHLELSLDNDVQLIPKVFASHH